ncbi:hypothetical protein BLAT2472_20122 [Burkholderia latens]
MTHSVPTSAATADLLTTTNPPRQIEPRAVGPLPKSPSDRAGWRAAERFWRSTGAVYCLI